VSEGLGVRKVIDSNKIYLAVAKTRTQNVSSDTPKTINSYLYTHLTIIASESFIWSKA